MKLSKGHIIAVVALIFPVAAAWGAVISQQPSSSASAIPTLITVGKSVQKFVTTPQVPVTLGSANPVVIPPKAKKHHKPVVPSPVVSKVWACREREDGISLCEWVTPTKK